MGLIAPPPPPPPPPVRSGPLEVSAGLARSIRARRAPSSKGESVERRCLRLPITKRLAPPLEPHDPTVRQGSWRRTSRRGRFPSPRPTRRKRYARGDTPATRLVLSVRFLVSHGTLPVSLYGTRNRTPAIRAANDAGSTGSSPSLPCSSRARALHEPRPRSIFASPAPTTSCQHRFYELRSDLDTWGGQPGELGLPCTPRDPTLSEALWYCR